MKILLLTSKLGNGHARAAEAIACALRERMPGVVIQYLDLWSLMDKRVADAVKDGYLRMARDYPDYYQRLYDLDEDLWRQLSGREAADISIKRFLSAQQKKWFPEGMNWLSVGRENIDRALINSLIRLICFPRHKASHQIVLNSLLIFIRTILLNRMKEKILRFSPDVVIATQMYPAVLLSHLKSKNNFSDVPTVGVITDYGLQKVWARSNTDVYCVGNEDLFAPLQALRVSATRIRHTGIPLMGQFKHPPDMMEARQKLHLPPERRTVLITGGQYGLGVSEPVADLARSTKDYQILITVGQSCEETDELYALRDRYPGRVKIFSWMDAMATLISAADVVIGKPGGLSVSESLACGRPFFATCSLGGQEQHNINFLSRHRAGGAVAPHHLISKLNVLFDSPAEMECLKRRAYLLGRRDGAERVAGIIEALYFNRKAMPCSGFGVRA